MTSLRWSSEQARDSRSFPDLRQFRLFESDDVQDTEQRIAAVLQPHRLRSRGRTSDYRAHMDYLRLGAVSLGSISFGQMALDVDCIGNHHVIIFCVRGHGTLQVNGREIESNAQHGVSLAPGDRLHGEFSEDCEQIIMRIDGPALRRFTELRTPRFESSINLHDPRYRPWAQFLQSTLSDREVMSMVLKSAHVAASYESLFVSMLLGNEGVTEDAGSGSIAPASVRRAEAYIEANFADPITLGDIAASSCVPVRTLLDSFKKFRGVSPMRYLRDTRLDAARVALLRAGDETTVMDTALDCGFGHIGRFAACYFKRFGEKPSATLSGDIP